MVKADNTLTPAILAAFQSRLPRGWSVSETRLPTPAQIDAMVEVASPSGLVGRIAIENEVRLEPRDVGPIVAFAREALGGALLLVAAPYLSPTTRERLRERDVSYLDLTGNAHIVLQEPGLFVETQGESRDPYRRERPVRTLRGTKAGRVIRALIDSRCISGVRELASMTKVDAGHVSRILSFLDAESLLRRDARGRIENVDWPALLRRWATEAPIECRGKSATYLFPRGPMSFIERLRGLGCTYAITAGFAAAAYAPVTPTMQLVVWIHDGGHCAESLGLVAAAGEGNTRLIEPDDQWVFVHTYVHEQCTYVAPSQAVADLLISPGRGAAKAEVLIEWMRANESAWRL